MPSPTPATLVTGRGEAPAAPRWELLGPQFLPLGPPPRPGAAHRSVLEWEAS